MGREVQIITTEDGSHSLYLLGMNETYHSSRGALTESTHIFIKAGLDYYCHKSDKALINILEIGFGTGLNALLAQRYAEAEKQPVSFTSLEPFPLPAAIYEDLNYSGLLGLADQSQFLELHKARWNETVELSEYFSLKKLEVTLQQFTSNERFDLIFFDAFAPSKQAELWEYEILEKTVGQMAPSAVLVTYCAKGQFKRDLAALGLTVETLPGPPGKKEMVRAVTPG